MVAMGMLLERLCWRAGKTLLFRRCLVGIPANKLSSLMGRTGETLELELGFTGGTESVVDDMSAAAACLRDEVVGFVGIASRTIWPGSTSVSEMLVEPEEEFEAC